MINIFESLKEIDKLMVKHNDYRENYLNLIASENYINPVIRKYLDFEVIKELNLLLISVKGFLN